MGEEFFLIQRVDGKYLRPNGCILEFHEAPALYKREEMQGLIARIATYKPELLKSIIVVEAGFYPKDNINIEDF